MIAGPERTAPGLPQDYLLKRMAAKRATIIFNPASGRAGRRAENARAMVQRLAEAGTSAEAHATVEAEDATRLTRDAVCAGSEIVISYGGDGTLNEIVQGLAHGPANLLVWAGGTANVVAGDLGMPRRIERLADIAAAGKTRRVALGVATRADACAAGSSA